MFSRQHFAGIQHGSQSGDLAWSIKMASTPPVDAQTLASLQCFDLNRKRLRSRILHGERFSMIDLNANTFIFISNDLRQI